MKCPQCSTETASDAAFCHKCGAKLGSKANAKSAGDATPKDQFVDKLPRPGDAPENDLWHGGYSGRAMYGTWLLLLGATIGAIVLAVFVPPLVTVLGIVVPLLWVSQLFVLAYRKLAIRYQLTCQRFVHRSGIFHQRTDRIEVIDIDDVVVTQTLPQRIFGVGTIRLASSDRSHPELLMPGIANVDSVAALIDDTRRTERRRRGIHIETI